MKKWIFLFFLCFAHATFATTFYIDPQNGSDDGDGSAGNPWRTLEYVVAANLIESQSYVLPYDPDNPQLQPKNQGAPVKAGDTLLLFGGLHGELFLVNYINEAPITVMAAEGEEAVLKSIHLQAGKKWRFEGLTVSSEPYDVYINNKLVFLESHSWQGPVSEIEISNCHIYSAQEPWTTAEAWVNQVSDGIYIKGDSVSAVNNLLSNVSFGIVMSGDYIQAEGNVIENFSADGIRIGGSFDIVEANVIKNCYKVDDNHDDGIQSFTTNGLVVDNNIVRRNIILNYEDPEQPLLGYLQGIGCFDGFYNNWIVENNLIVVDHWHGIAFYGAHNCLIVNNTVLDPTPEATPGPAWIRIEDLNGTVSTGCVVKNNVTNTLQLNGATLAGNNSLLSSEASYQSNFVDYANFDFHLLENSNLIDAADTAFAPADDLDGNLRADGGPLPDIGAYEYILPVGTKEEIGREFKFTVFPNPFSTALFVQGKDVPVDVSLTDASGKKLLILKEQKLPLSLPLEALSLEAGVYFLRISTGGEVIETHRLVKL